MQKKTRLSGAKVIHLDHIARFQDVPADVRDYLARVDVGKAPEPGREVKVAGHELSRIFRGPISKVHGENDLRILFKVPQEVVIVNEGYVFDEDEVRERLLEKLRSQCADCEFEVAELNLPKLPEDMKATQWNIQFPADPVKGGFSLPVTFEGGEKSRTFWISGRAVKRQLVPVAARRLEAGQRIAKGDFVMAMRDTTFAIDGVPQEAQLIDQKLRHGIMVDHVIWRDNLERKKALSYGDKAQVIMGQDGWEIQSVAIAQENADIGDTVRLLNPKTRKYISGVVIGEKTVKVK